MYIPLFIISQDKKEDKPLQREYVYKEQHVIFEEELESISTDEEEETQRGVLIIELF